MWQRRSYRFARPVPYDPRESFSLAALGRDPSFQRIPQRGFRCLRWYNGELIAYTVGWSDSALVVALDGLESAVAQFQEEDAKALLGLHDEGRLELSSETRDPMASYAARVPGLRLTRLPWPYEGGLQVVLSQRVSWAEASANWQRLCRNYGEFAEEMWSAPSPKRLLGLSMPEFARCGIEEKRAIGLKGIAHALGPLRDFSRHSGEALQRKLDGLARIGPWTKALLRGQIWGEPDVVPLGDYGLPDLVCRALAKERHGNDERMLELLAPYLGQRFRVIRLLWAGSPKGERRGPRLPQGQGLGPTRPS